MRGMYLHETTSHQARMRTWAAIALIALLGVAIPAGKAQAQAGTESADGCNGYVCIFVDGSGLVVTKWRTTASVSSYRCEYAYFKRNGYAVKIMEDCGSSTLSTTWDNPGTFSHGDELCNTWSNVSGEPCITIYE